MDWSTNRARAVSILQREGFRPEIDSDGDIWFKFQGGAYYILQTTDNTFFQVMFPGFWKMNGGEDLGAAMLAASRANRDTKVAKLWASSDLHRMNASAEIFMTSWTDLNSAILLRCVSCIRTAVDTFVEEVRKLR